MSFRRGRVERARNKRLGLLPGPFASRAGTGTLSGDNGEALTFTRATTKYVETAPGVVASVASGAPAVGANGLVVEAAHTNLLVSSQAIGNGNWGNADVVATLNAAVAPDGTSTASRLDIGGTDGSYCYNSLGSFSNAPYAFSVWVKGVSGSGTIYASLQDAGGTYSTATGTFNSSTWTRITGTGTPAAGGAYFVLGNANGNSPTQPAQSVYAWGAQVETGTFARSYVPTPVSAATGNKDVVSMSGAGLPTSSGSVEFLFTPNWSTTAGIGTPTLIRSATGAANVGIYINIIGLGTGWLRLAIGAQTVDIAGNLVWVAGQTYRIRATWGSGLAAMYRDGVLLASGSGLTMPTSHGTLYVGNDDSGSGQIDGSISDLVFYDN